MIPETISSAMMDVVKSVSNEVNAGLNGLKIRYVERIR